jgi:hypothetical protein
MLANTKQETYVSNGRISVLAMGKKIFFFISAFRPVLWPQQPPIKKVQRAISLGVDWPKREANHSPPYID